MFFQGFSYPYPYEQSEYLALIALIAQIAQIAEVERAGEEEEKQAIQKYTIHRRKNQNAGHIMWIIITSCIIV